VQGTLVAVARALLRHTQHARRHVRRVCVAQLCGARARPAAQPCALCRRSKTRRTTPSCSV
jgi:hypothetical protein